MKRSKVQILTVTSATVVCLATTGIAHGQVAAAPAEPKPDDGTVVTVTGSRLVKTGNTAPTPVTVLSKDQLTTAAPTTISDALAQVPQFRGSQRPSSFVTPQVSTGSFLNLRGLGTTRSLILIDGRRTVPVAANNTIDVNTFPDLLMKRVDIVTGGASAAYGSDAVAGVVNFVLDDTFTGIKGDVGYGISSRNDNETEKARFAFGTTLFDGRVHTVSSVDYFRNRGILNDDKRDWDKQHVDIIANPTYGTDGRTAFLWRSGVTGTQFATGGVIISGPLQGTQFLAGGTPATFHYGTEVSASTMVGGDGYWNPRGNMSSPVRSLNLFNHTTFDVSDTTKVFAELSASETKSFFYGTSPSYNGGTAITIYNDNAYLPAATKLAMSTAKITNFKMGRISPDWGRNEGVSDTKILRGAIGLSSKLGSWDFDVSADFGSTKAHLENNHSPNQQNLFNALDSVINPATNQAVCRSTLVNPTNGCVPLNPFGYGSASAAAINYVFGTGAWSNTYVNQQNYEATIRGAPFVNWAGPVDVALGLAWRHTDVRQEADALSTTILAQAAGSKGMPASLVNKVGVFLTGNQAVQPKKAIEVGEVFAEAQLPLLRDLPLAKSLDLNAAVRHANYSATGGVTSWKVGLVYVPADQWRLRATQSRDIRAPNINELYSPALASLGTIADPVTHTNNNIPLYTGGNAKLSPEIADSLTLGTVYSPSWLRGASVTVDYYNVKVDGAIDFLNGQNIMDLCTAGKTSYCTYITRLSDNTLVSITRPYLNLNRLNTDGVDVELNYARSYGGGRLTFRSLVAYLNKLESTDPFGTTTNQAGVNGGEQVGTPHWQGRLSFDYRYKALDVFLQERIIGSGKYSSTYVVGGTAANSIDYNHVGGRTYTDLTIKYSIERPGQAYEIYATVNNLFDTDPPASPSRIGAPASILGTNPTLYDVVGQYINVGLRFKY